MLSRIFAQYTKQGNKPSPTDVLPPLSWLQRSSIKGVLKWEGCSVKVTKKAERSFLSIPSYSSSDLKANEESGSLYNHLFVLLAKSEVFFARALWHGCTADQIIEIAPFRCAFQSLSSILVIDYGSVRRKNALRCRSIWSGSFWSAARFSRRFMWLPVCFVQDPPPIFSLLSVMQRPS